jgi:hypothetical protein
VSELVVNSIGDLVQPLAMGADRKRGLGNSHD